MAHKIVNGISVVDWQTGDPEGDRAYLFQAYRDFLREVRESDNAPAVFERWGVKELDIDEFPRIAIKRPE